MKMELAAVRLRLLKQQDFKELWKLATPAVFEHMLTKVETEEQLTSWLQAGLDQPNALVLIAEDVHTGEVYGTTRVYAIDAHNKSCEIGSTFYGEQAQRTHVNTAVKGMLLTHCFEQLGMIRVQFKTDAENKRSQRALERIGAVREGVLRNERIRSTGKPRDAAVYSIIDAEWPKTKTHLEALLNKYT